MRIRQLFSSARGRRLFGCAVLFGGIVLLASAGTYAAASMPEPVPDHTKLHQHLVLFGGMAGLVAGLCFLGGYAFHSRRLRARALDQSEHRFREMLESTTDWTWEIDAAWRFTYANPHVNELLGYEPAEIIGKTPFDLMPPDEASRMSAIFSGVIALSLVNNCRRNISL